MLIRTTTVDSVKARVAREADARIFDLAPWIFLWYPVDVWAENPRVEGWHIPAIFNGQRWQEVQVRP